MLTLYNNGWISWKLLNLTPPTSPQRHSSGSVHSERHRSPLLLPSHLQNRPGVHQSHRGEEENGGNAAKSSRFLPCRQRLDWMLWFQNVVALAEAGCLDPRIFCTSCMVGQSTQHESLLTALDINTLYYSNTVLLFLLFAGKETNKSQSLLQLRCLCCEAGPPLRLDQHLHRYDWRVTNFRLIP